MTSANIYKITYFEEGEERGTKALKIVCEKNITQAIEFIKQYCNDNGSKYLDIVDVESSDYRNVWIDNCLESKRENIGDVELYKVEYNKCMCMLVVSSSIESVIKFVKGFNKDLEKYVTIFSVKLLLEDIDGDWTRLKNA